MIGHAKTLNRFQAAQIMFFINAAIWMVFGVFSLTTMIASDAVPAIAAWFIAILMWGNAGAILIAGA